MDCDPQVVVEGRWEELPAAVETRPQRLARVVRRRLDDELRADKRL